MDRLANVAVDPLFVPAERFDWEGRKELYERLVREISALPRPVVWWTTVLGVPRPRFRGWLAGYDFPPPHEQEVLWRVLLNPELAEAVALLPPPPTALVAELVDISGVSRMRVGRRFGVTAGVVQRWLGGQAVMRASRCRLFYFLAYDAGLWEPAAPADA